MNKHTLLLSAPVDTYSGYGARARDIVKALLKIDKYDIKILSQRWGNTRFGYLADHAETEIENLIVDKITARPDIWIQISVPNEFAPMGKFNLGITAGIETTLCHGTWIEGCNRMDLVLTSSQHSKNVFENTVLEKINNATKQPEGEIRLNKPVEVLFEGADLTKYFPTKTKANLEINLELDGIKESFCYLAIGHWMQGNLGHDRKNLGYTVKAFLEGFKNKTNPPALIIKTQEVGSSILDQSKVLDKIQKIRETVKGKLPNIYLIHGELTDDEINELYNHPKVKVMVSHTKGEGFGRPLLEFSLIGKPIIASGWSGHTDFLDNSRAILVGGKLHNLDKSSLVNNILLPESQWFQPDDQQVKVAFRETFKKYKNYIDGARKLRRENTEKFSLESMTTLLESTLDKYTSGLPKQMELKLPKMELPKLQKNG